MLCSEEGVTSLGAEKCRVSAASCLRCHTGSTTALSKKDPADKVELCLTLSC